MATELKGKCNTKVVFQKVCSGRSGCNTKVVFQKVCSGRSGCNTKVELQKGSGCNTKAELGPKILHCLDVPKVSLHICSASIVQGGAFIHQVTTLADFATTHSMGREGFPSTSQKMDAFFSILMVVQIHMSLSQNFHVVVHLETGTSPKSPHGEELDLCPMPRWEKTTPASYKYGHGPKARTPSEHPSPQ